MSAVEATPAIEERIVRACLVLVLVGLALRIAFLLREDLWFDEVWSVHTCRQPWESMLAALMQDNHPDAYHAGAKAFCELLGGPAKLTMRLFSLLWGVATIALAWGAGLRLLGSRAQAWVAAAAVALSPQQVYYSQEARMYAMGGALMLLAAWCALEIARRVETGERHDLALMLGGPIAAAAAANTHFVTVFALPCLALALWHFGPRGDRRFVRSFLAFWGLVALACVPVVTEVLLRRDQIGRVSGWIPTPMPEDLLRSLGRTWMVHQDLAYLQHREGVRWLFVLDLVPVAIAGWLMVGCASLAGPARRVAGVALGTYAGAQLLQYAATNLGVPAFFWLRYSSLVFPVAAIGIAALAVPAIHSRPHAGNWLGAAVLIMIGTGIAGGIYRNYTYYGPIRDYLARHPDLPVAYVYTGEHWAEFSENIRDPRLRAEMYLGADLLSGRAPETLVIIVDEPWFRINHLGRGARVDTLLQERDTYMILDEPKYRLFELRPLDWLPVAPDDARPGVAADGEVRP